MISEPYRVPKNHANWASDDAGSVAITWRTTQDFLSCILVEQRPGIVVVDWSIYTLISVYVSPNVSMIEFERWLANLADCVNKRPARPKIIAGDFNSKSQMWGATRTNARGKAVETWAAQNSLTLVNTGKNSTCVRQMGESIIDLTWASPAAARRIVGWRVAEDRETLSDHKMIEFVLSPFTNLNTSMGPNRKRNETIWAVRKLDVDRLRAAIEAALWTQNWEGLQDLPEKIEWLQNTLTRACDVAMPKSKMTNKRPAYWWSEELAQLRRASIHANKVLSRARKSNDPQRVEQAWQDRRTRDKHWQRQLEKPKLVRGKRLSRISTGTHGVGLTRL